VGVAMTDDEIRAAVIGELVEHITTLHLAEYDPH
jgi:hypothetical protein